MRCTLAILLFVFVNLCICRAVNYCGSKMCGHTNSHTFCQYPLGPSPRCTGYMDAHLLAEEKLRIMARLNRRRNEVAWGQLRRLPPAGNMLKLRWVEELSREAQRWADQCRPPGAPDERDACRDLYSTSVGQCVASVVGEAPGLRVESMIDIWYMQNILYKGNVTSYVAPTTNSSYYGDFAQITWAHTYMVGCGRSRFMVPRNGRLRSVERLVCNFAPRGPTAGQALWIPTVPATACPPRSLPDIVMPGLCNYLYNLDESNDIDNTMSLEEHALLNTLLEVETNEVLNYLGSIDELYLTKIAIATMENSLTTLSYYNSMHKRDIMEKITRNETTNLNNIIPNNILHDKPNAIMNMSTFIEPVTNIFKAKMVNLIGRPKSYNIEELNEIGDSIITENHLDGPDKSVSMVESNLYGDYEYGDNQGIQSIGDEATTKIITLNDNMKIELEAVENIIVATANREINESSYTSINSVKDNADISKMYYESIDTNKSLQIPELSLMNSTNVSLQLHKKEEDYLSDSETVSELQEALDRMEQSLETSTVTSSKVRRELRESPGQVDANNDQIIRDAYPDSVKKILAPPLQEIDSNKSAVEKAPMLNMVLRYMPYLKPYEHNILESVTSGANVIHSALSVVIFTVYLL